MNQAIGYTRVSTTEQATHGVSLDAQEARIRAYATMAGLDLVDIIREEGVSASKALATRPGGRELGQLVAAGRVKHIISLKLDRVFRDVLDAVSQTRTWDKLGVHLHLVDMGGQTLNTGSAMGKMFFTLTAAFAELERNLISERTSQALQHKRAQGVRLGAPRFCDDATIGRLRELKAQGMPLRQMCGVMTQEGYRTLRSDRWFPETIRRALAGAGGGKSGGESS